MRCCHSCGQSPPPPLTQNRGQVLTVAQGLPDSAPLTALVPLALYPSLSSQAVLTSWLYPEIPSPHPHSPQGLCTAFPFAGKPPHRAQGGSLLAAFSGSLPGATCKSVPPPRPLHSLSTSLLPSHQSTDRAPTHWSFPYLHISLHLPVSGCELHEAGIVLLCPQYLEGSDTQRVPHTAGTA